VLPAVGFPHRAPAGCRAIPAQEVGGHLEENAPALGQPRDAQAITESGEHSALFSPSILLVEGCERITRQRRRGGYVVRRLVLSDASDFLKKWVRKNITPTTAHIRDDTLTAGRLAEECLWEARGQNLSEDEVIDAAGGNLFTFVVAELNRAADQKID
jgi:hypothetical protein